MKFHSYILKFSALFLVFFMISCEEKTKKKTPEITPETEAEKAETESQSHAGTMKLTLKDRTVLADINTFGVCGC